MDLVQLIKRFYDVYSIGSTGESKKNDILTEGGNEIKIGDKQYDLNRNIEFNTDDVKLIEKALEEKNIEQFLQFKKYLNIVLDNMADGSLLEQIKNIKLGLDIDDVVTKIMMSNMVNHINPTINKEIMKIFPEIIDAEHVDEDESYLYVFSEAHYGATIFSLYLSMVCHKETINIFIKKIKENIKYENIHTISSLEKMLNCDYVRHIRNSMAHGTFFRFLGGIRFQDRNNQVFAPESLISQVSFHINLIMLQIMVASK